MSFFFIADTHFGDENIIRYESRPFSNADEMDRAITENWNKTVSDEDTVFVLGDLSSYGKEKTSAICKSLKGKKVLIKGNHDTESNDYYRECGFENVIEYPIILDNFWILSHEPMYVNKNMPYANIFGHIHNNPMYKTASEQSFCVSVERIEYKPIKFDEIKEEIMRQVK